MLLAMLAALGAVPADAESFTLRGDDLELVFRTGSFEVFHAQLLCLSDTFGCSREATEAVWRDAVAPTPRSWAVIETFAAALRQYEAHLDQGEPPALPRASPRRWSLQGKVLRAFLASRDEAGLRLALETLLNPGDVDALLEPVHTLHPAFERWWKKEGRKPAMQAAKEAARVAKEGNLLPLAAKVRAFYGSPVKGVERITFHCVPRFKSAGQTSVSTSATVLEHEAYLEIVPGEDLHERLDVAFHEVFHAFFWERSEVQSRALAQAFAAPELGPATHSLIDEGLATALGNGLVARQLISKAAFEKSLARPRSWYSVPLIDVAGKAWFPIVTQALENGVSLDTIEPKTLIEALLKQAGPAALNEPQLFFFARGLVAVNEADVSALQKLNDWRAIHTSLDTGAEERWSLERYPAMSGVIVVRSSELASLKSHPLAVSAAELQALSKRSEGLYGIARRPGVDLYVAIGADTAALTRQIEAFVAANKRFTGWR